MALLVFFVALASVHLLTPAQGQFRPPKSYDGFVYGVTDAPPHPTILEAYFDFTCPDCLAAWPILKRLPKVYGLSRLLLIVHPFVLP